MSAIDDLADAALSGDDCSFAASLRIGFVVSFSSQTSRLRFHGINRGVQWRQA